MLDWTNITEATKHYLKQSFKPGDIILSYTDSHTPGIMTPLIIRKAEDIDSVMLNPLCVQNLAVYFSEFFQFELLSNKPLKGRWFITIKPCDVRSVVQMIEDEQILKDQLEMIIFDCDGTVSAKDIKMLIKKEIREIIFNGNEIQLKTLTNEEIIMNAKDVFQKKCSNRAICSMPSITGYTFIGEKTQPDFPEKEQIQPLIQHSLSQQDCYAKVVEELQKCIRCNACRNICPACFCSDHCIMDKPKLAVPFITKEITLDQILQYHLIRFYHVAPNCTACGECERVCPQGISLSIFYLYLHQMNEKEFGSKSGASDSDKQKLLSYRFGEDLV